MSRYLEVFALLAVLVFMVLALVSAASYMENPQAPPGKNINGHVAFYAKDLNWPESQIRWLALVWLVFTALAVYDALFRWPSGLEAAIGFASFCLVAPFGLCRSLSAWFRFGWDNRLLYAELGGYLEAGLCVLLFLFYLANFSARLRRYAAA